MDWKTKTIIGGITVLILIALVFIIKIQNDTINRLKFIETSVVESKDLGDGLVRAQAQYVTKKDLERIIKEQDINIGKIRKDMKVLGADVKGVNVIKIVTPGSSQNNLPSSEIIPNPNKSDENRVQDNFGYLTNSQWINLTEPFESGTRIPFGRAGFSAWKKNPWSLRVFPREYSSTTIIGTNEDGRHYAYSKFLIEVDGEKYAIPISEAKIIEEYPEESFSFNPRLYLGVDGGVIANPPAHGEITPNITLSLASYGKTKINPSWSFIGVGLGYAAESKAPVLVVSPVNYNIGHKLPLITNFYIGPSVSADISGNFGIYIGGKVGL